jgi:hypothetical protein
VEVEPLSDEEVVALSALVVVEHRRGVQTVYAARCRHVLRRTDGEWRIAAKKVDLVNSDEAMGNLSFIV